MTTITPKNIPTLSSKDNVCLQKYRDDIGNYNPMNEYVKQYGSCLENVYKNELGVTEEDKCKKELSDNLAKIKDDPILTKASRDFMICVTNNNTTAPPANQTTNPTTAPFEMTTGMIVGIVLGSLAFVILILLFINRGKVKEMIKTRSKKAEIAAVATPVPVIQPVIPSPSPPSGSKISTSKSSMGSLRKGRGKPLIKKRK